MWGPLGGPGLQAQPGQGVCAGELRQVLELLHNDGHLQAATRLNSAGLWNRESSACIMNQSSLNEVHAIWQRGSKVETTLRSQTLQTQTKVPSCN